MTEKPSEKHTPATDKPAAPATDETGGVVLSAQPPLSSAPPPKPRAAESSQPVRGASQPQAGGQPQASQAVPANAQQAAPSGSQAAPRAQDIAEAAQRASAAPAQAGNALRHPTQVRVITTRSDLAAQPTQINSHTVSIPWNPDPTRGDDVEVNVPPDAQRSLRTGLAFHVAPGYEAIITCAGSEPGHRQPIAWLQGKAKEELVIRFRNNGQQTRTFLAGQELGQLTLRKLDALDLAFSDPHAAQADADAE